ncbi:unnamed protein product [Pedinophyceae sp. YPF-701]|nr:unnamed protein product [Pedinophyceae sp. YPF-701]
MERARGRPARGRPALGPEALVGCALRVYWPADDRAYPGVVASYDRPTRTHVVEYEDGETERLDLSKEQVEWIDGPSCVGRRVQVLDSAADDGSVRGSSGTIVQFIPATKSRGHTHAVQLDDGRFLYAAIGPDCALVPGAPVVTSRRKRKAAGRPHEPASRVGEQPDADHAGTATPEGRGGRRRKRVRARNESPRVAQRGAAGAASGTPQAAPLQVEASPRQDAAMTCGAGDRGGAEEAAPQHNVSRRKHLGAGRVREGLAGADVAADEDAGFEDGASSGGEPPALSDMNDMFGFTDESGRVWVWRFAAVARAGVLERATSAAAACRRRRDPHVVVRPEDESSADEGAGDAAEGPATPDGRNRGADATGLRRVRASAEPWAARVRRWCFDDHDSFWDWVDDQEVEFTLRDDSSDEEDTVQYRRGPAGARGAPSRAESGLRRMTMSGGTFWAFRGPGEARRAFVGRRNERRPAGVASLVRMRAWLAGCAAHRDAQPPFEFGPLPPKCTVRAVAERAVWGDIWIRQDGTFVDEDAWERGDVDVYSDATYESEGEEGRGKPRAPRLLRRKPTPASDPRMLAALVRNCSNGIQSALRALREEPAAQDETPSRRKSKARTRAAMSLQQTFRRLSWHPAAATAARCAGRSDVDARRERSEVLQSHQALTASLQRLDRQTQLPEDTLLPGPFSAAQLTELVEQMRWVQDQVGDAVTPQPGGADAEADETAPVSWRRQKMPADEGGVAGVRSQKAFRFLVVDAAGTTTPALEAHARAPANPVEGSEEAGEDAGASVAASPASSRLVYSRCAEGSSLDFWPGIGDAKELNRRQAETWLDAVVALSQHGLLGLIKSIQSAVESFEDFRTQFRPADPVSAARAPRDGAGSRRRGGGRRPRVWEDGPMAIVDYGLNEPMIWQRRVAAALGRCRRVLGDRRVDERWGSTVLDAIIGTHLTQTVSDVLSASAIMNLRARFPHRSVLPGREARRDTTQRRRQDAHRHQGCGESAIDDCTDVADEAGADGAGRHDRHADRGCVQDTVDWQAVLEAPVDELAEAIKCRGLHRILARRIQNFLRSVLDLGRKRGLATRGAEPAEAEAGPARGEQDMTLCLEHLHEAADADVADYLMNTPGLGHKSTSCIMLLALNRASFPVDVNVVRICARLGWVPLKSERVLEDLEDYGAPEIMNEYLQQKLVKYCNVATLQELHYVFITLGKVFCRARDPACAACPLEDLCEHGTARREARKDAATITPEYDVSHVEARGAGPAATPTAHTQGLQTPSRPSGQRRRGAAASARDSTSTPPGASSPESGNGSVNGPVDAGSPAPSHDAVVDLVVEVCEGAPASAWNDDCQLGLEAMTSRVAGCRGLKLARMAAKLVPGCRRVLNFSQAPTRRSGSEEHGAGSVSDEVKLARRVLRQVCARLHPDRNPSPRAADAFSLATAAVAEMDELMEALKGLRGDETSDDSDAGAGAPGSDARELARASRSPLSSAIGRSCHRIPAIRVPAGAVGRVQEAHRAAAGGRGILHGTDEEAVDYDAHPMMAFVSSLSPREDRGVLDDSAEGTAIASEGLSTLVGEWMQEELRDSPCADGERWAGCRGLCRGMCAQGVAAVTSRPVAVRLLVPVYVAMQGRFPLRGTYFQVNEVLLDHVSDTAPLVVPLSSILGAGASPRCCTHAAATADAAPLLAGIRWQMIYFGSSTARITNGMSGAEVRALFSSGAICVRGIDVRDGTPTRLPEWVHRNRFRTGGAGNFLRAAEEARQMAQARRREVGAVEEQDAPAGGVGGDA